MAEKRLYKLAAAVGAALKARGLSLATAESCTGGWIGEAVTMIPGSSHWYERGFITYTNVAKCEMLGVPPGNTGKMRRCFGGNRHCNGGRRACQKSRAGGHCGEWSCRACRRYTG